MGRQITRVQVSKEAREVRSLLRPETTDIVNIPVPVDNMLEKRTIRVRNFTLEMMEKNFSKSRIKRESNKETDTVQ